MEVWRTSIISAFLIAMVLGQEHHLDKNIHSLILEVQALRQELVNSHTDITDIRNQVHETKHTIAKIEHSLQPVAKDPEKYLEEKMEKTLKDMQREHEISLKKIKGMLTGPMSGNKQILEKLQEIDSRSGNDRNCMANQLPGLAEEVRKQIGERINSEFNILRLWLQGTVERLSYTEMKCEQLVKNIENTKNQCIKKLSEKTDQNVLDDLKEEIHRNLSRVQREIKTEMEQKMTELLQNVQINPVQQTTKTVTTASLILPTLPTTLQPPVRHNCNKVLYMKKAENCADLKKIGGVTCDGTYVIHPQKKKAVLALCDMTTIGGGWTVIMRRGDFGGPNTNFYQKWSQYKQGFGRLQKEFWLGNENVHLLTTSPNNNTQELLVQLESFQGEQVSLLYEYVALEDERHQYRIHLGNVSGNYHLMASPLAIANQRIFRTQDRNEGIENCASKQSAGWWFGESCDPQTGILTAPYFEEDDFRENWEGIRWPAWKRDGILKSVQMKIRNKGFL